MSCSASAPSGRPAPSAAPLQQPAWHAMSPTARAGAIGLYRNDFTRSTAGAPVLVPAIAVAVGAWALSGSGR